MITRIIFLYLCSWLVAVSQPSRTELKEYVETRRLAGEEILLEPRFGGDFSKYDFSGLELQQVNFKGCDLNNSNFEGSALVEANFVGSVFTQVNCKRAKLNKAVFISVNIGGSVFDHADLREVIGFGEVENLRVSAKHADFSGADLSQLDLSKIDFTGSNLDRSNLNQSRLEAADLTLDHLGDASVNVTLLLGNASGEFREFLRRRGAIVERDQLMDLLRASIPFRQFSFSNFDFSGANLEGVNFSSYDLSEANFSEANLRNAVFDEANLRGAKWQDTELNGASFKNAICSQGDFTNAQIDGADFTGAKLMHTNFTKVRGMPVQDLEALRDESDYEWNSFLNNLWDYLDEFFPIVYFIAFIYVIFSTIVFFTTKKKAKPPWLGAVVRGSLAWEIFILMFFLIFKSLVTMAFFTGLGILLLLMLGLSILFRSLISGRRKMLWFGLGCIVAHSVVLFGFIYYIGRALSSV